MNQTNSKSLLYSRISVVLFMIVLAAADAGGWWLVDWFISITRYRFAAGIPVQILFMASLYLCSVPAWVVLVLLGRLLHKIGGGQIFVAENVSALRGISWCCFAAAVICLVSAVYYLPFLLAAAAAAFMALIVRIVKNCFEEATGMKNELDYTI